MNHNSMSSPSLPLTGRTLEVRSTSVAEESYQDKKDKYKASRKLSSKKNVVNQPTSSQAVNERLHKGIIIRILLDL